MIVEQFCLTLQSLIRLRRTNTTAQLTFLSRVSIISYKERNRHHLRQKVAICFYPNVSANWNLNGCSVIKKPVQAYAMIRASVTIMSSLMLFRGSVRGNNPTAVAAVMANTAHLLCLILRAPLSIFNPRVFVLTNSTECVSDGKYSHGSPPLQAYGLFLAPTNTCTAVFLSSALLRNAVFT